MSDADAAIKIEKYCYRFIVRVHTFALNSHHLVLRLKQQLR